MSKCWAAVLGDCSDSLSREHVVSKSWYGVKTVTVTGMPWCRDAPKTVGVENLTAKVLCRSHNSRLSPVDVAGTYVCKTLDICVDLGSRRATNHESSWSHDGFSVDGPLFERWLVKTAINLMVARDLNAANDAHSLESVPEKLVRVAFGLDTLSMPTGVYTAFQSDEIVGPKDRMTIGVLVDPKVGLLGVLFSIQGFRFMLWLGLQAPPNPLNLSGIIEADWQKSYVYRHLGQLRWKVNGKQSHYIDFGWPEQTLTNLTLFV